MTVQEILMMRVGFKADKGIEMTLLARAQADGKPIDGLETVDEQLGLSRRAVARHPDSLAAVFND